MSFKILLLAPDADPSWPEKIRRVVPGIVVNAYSDPQDALDDIADADAAYGTVPPELLARAQNLRWICAARAGLGGAWFYDALVKSDVVVTNMRGSYNEHLAAQPSRSSSPSPAASITTCRRSAGSEVRR
jgi:phosphoglycerate dehydrogenase-like enzyme